MIEKELFIAQLLAKKLRDPDLLTDLEQKQLEEWVVASPKYQQLLDELQEESTLAGKLGDYYKTNQQTGWNKVLNGLLAEKEPSQVVTRSLWTKLRLAVAAAVATVIFGTGLFYFHQQQSVLHTAMQDVAPGRNGATLTLANGNKIYITAHKSGKLADESGVTISKTADGQIVYQVLEGQDNPAQGINMLETANGEQAKVSLPDGTVVFLNSASTLKYPASFSKQAKRRVELLGEGYFQVSKDKAHPFVVKTGQQQVEVLGTEFNVNSYAGEAVSSTTLLEGSVKVIGNNGEVRILKPNQQALNSAEGIIVKEVEAQFFIDWKEGFFMFNNESLESIMKRVARWYNVKVVYEDAALRNKTFVGTISRYEKISGVITVLEGTGLIKFKINNDVLTISAKK